MRSYFLLVQLLFLSVLLSGQDQAQSALDSLNMIRQQEYEERLKIENQERMAAFKALDPDSVAILDLRKLSLTEVPDLELFVELKELFLQGNSLTTFKAKDIGSKKLRYLDLSENNLQKVKFRRNDSLEVVKLNDCGLKKIPRSIKKLKGLKRLELDKNEIHKIPAFLRRMKKLEEINLSFNDLQVSEKDLKQLQKLTIIQLIGNNMTELPDNIAVLQAARKLNFSMNQLHDLPIGIGELDSLESLIFYKNSFDSIPAIVFDLASLNELDFYYNSIEEIPSQIDRLRQLKMLYISYNEISIIPENLKNIEGLQKLYIHHNQLIGLPPWIVKFQNLEVLDVGFNKLAVLPDFSPAISLMEVDVQQNNLSEIPWSILRLPKLERVFLKANPFEVSEEEANEFKELVESLMEKGVRVSF